MIDSVREGYSFNMDIVEENFLGGYRCLLSLSPSKRVLKQHYLDSVIKIDLTHKYF